MKAVLFTGIICAALIALPAAAQQVKSQLTVDDFNKLAPAKTDCQSDPNADCNPAKKSGAVQGFSIVGLNAKAGASAGHAAKAGGHHASTPAAASAPKADLMMSFEKNSSELTAQAKANADVFAQFLQTDRAKPYRYEIAGHTDRKGSSRYNQNLSQARAQAVRDYLVSHGVDAAKLDVKGYGYTRPLAHTSPLDPSNRRVEAACLNCRA